MKRSTNLKFFLGLVSLFLFSNQSHSQENKIYFSSFNKVSVEKKLRELNKSKSNLQIQSKTSEVEIFRVQSKKRYMHIYAQALADQFADVGLRAKLYFENGRYRVVLEHFYRKSRLLKFLDLLRQARIKNIEHVSLGEKKITLHYITDQNSNIDQDTLLSFGGSEDKWELETDENNSSSREKLISLKTMLEIGPMLNAGDSGTNLIDSRLELGLDWNLNTKFSLRLGALLSFYNQGGKSEKVFSELVPDYAENYLRYSNSQLQLTVGTQKISWGRVYENSIFDRLTRSDESRFLLDDFHDKKRALVAARAKFFVEKFSLDAVYLPIFQKSEQASSKSVWSLIDKSSGEIRGVESNPTLKGLVQNGSFNDEASDNLSHGFGTRISYNSSAFDLGLTYENVRLTNPYFRISDTVRLALALGNSVANSILASTSATFLAEYPQISIMGFDLGFEYWKATWRAEGAYLADIPVTTNNLAFAQSNGYAFNISAEFYPTDTDFQVNLQISTSGLITDLNVQNQEQSTYFAGQIEDKIFSDDWKYTFKFLVGLDSFDSHLKLKLSYIDLEPHNLYLVLHQLDGTDKSTVGINREQFTALIGWSYSY